MNAVLELLAGSWFALGLVKTTLIAAAGGLLISLIRQRDLAARLWAGLAFVLPLAFFSGTLPICWKALPQGERAERPHVETTARPPGC